MGSQAESVLFLGVKLESEPWRSFQGASTSLDCICPKAACLSGIMLSLCQLVWLWSLLTSAVSPLYSIHNALFLNKLVEISHQLIEDLLASGITFVFFISHPISSQSSVLLSGLLFKYGYGSINDVLKILCFH